MPIIETFYREGLPGMVLTADRPKPILTRCACGKVVSPNKDYCYACLVDALERVITGAADKDTVQKIMRQTSSAERGRMLLSIERLRVAAALPENQLP